jgi:hypothetical protein
MLFAWLSVLVLGAFGSPEWTWQAFPGDGFKILAPVALAMDQRLAPGPDQPIDYHQYHGGTLTDTAIGMAFVIDHYVLPVGEVEDSFADTLLRASFDELIRMMNAEVVYYEAGVHGGHPACLWKATFMDGEGIIRGKSVMAGNRYYGLQVFGKADDQPEKSMNKFLDSFQLQ